MFPWDAAAALTADCNADSPMLTGTTTGELFPAAESKDGVLLLADAASDCKDGSLNNWLAADWVRNGAANGNNEENGDAPLSAPSYVEPRSWIRLKKTWKWKVYLTYVGHWDNLD